MDRFMFDKEILRIWTETISKLINWQPASREQWSNFIEFGQQ